MQASEEGGTTEIGFHGLRSHKHKGHRLHDSKEKRTIYSPTLNRREQLKKKSVEMTKETKKAGERLSQESLLVQEKREFQRCSSGKPGQMLQTGGERRPKFKILKQHKNFTGMVEGAWTPRAEELHGEGVTQEQ